MQHSQFTLGYKFLLKLMKKYKPYFEAYGYNIPSFFIRLLFAVDREQLFMFDRIHDKIMDNTKLKRFKIKTKYMEDRYKRIMEYVKQIRQKQWHIPTPPIIKALYPAVARGVQEPTLPILPLPPVPAPQPPAPVQQPAPANDRQRKVDTPKILRAMTQKVPNNQDDWMNIGKDHEYLFGSSQKG